jgi:competence ComEA-like helix-hairpin-helix protein
MKFGKTQKTVLLIEIIAILAGGGVLAFVPDKPSRPPRIEAAQVTADTSGMTINRVEMLSAEEKAALEDFLKVDINTATADELQNIPRFGPSTATAIVAYRDQHGPFKSFAELDAIPRIGPSLLAILPKYARLSGVDLSAPAAAQEQAPGIDLNSATSEQLQTIPGVGASTADKIIAARPYRTVEDLLNVPGVGPSKFERWKSYVRVGASAMHVTPGSAAAGSPVAAAGGKVNINTASAEELQKLSGVGPSTAQAIVDFRAANGRFNTIEDLDKVPRIGPAFIEKVRPYVTL